MNDDVLNCFIGKLYGRTKKDYTKTINDFQLIINKPYLKAHREDVLIYIDHIEKINAPTTVQKKYHQLLSFFNYLFDNNHITVNPFKLVKKPKASSNLKRERVPSLDDLEKLLLTLKKKSLRNHAWAYLVSSTGLSLSNALNVKWSDFFIDMNGQKGLLIDKGTPKERYVYIIDNLWNTLQQYQEEWLQVDESYLKEDYYVFISRNDLTNYRSYPDIVKPLVESRIRPIFVNACKRANIPLYTARDLRHAQVALIKYFGASEESITKQMGWSSTEWIQRYNGVLMDLTDSANKKTETFFNSLDQKA